MRYYLTLNTTTDNQRTVHSKEQVAAVINYWLNKSLVDIEAFYNNVTIVKIPDHGDCKELDITEIIDIRRNPLYTVEVKN